MPEHTYQTFSLFFDSEDPGSPLYHHSMNTSDLTQVVNSFSALMKEVNKALNGSESEISVRVHAFAEGSFGIPFEILQAPEAIDVLRALGIITTGGVVSFAGLLALIQKLGRRKITKIKYRQKEGDYLISVDGEDVPCTKTERKLITNAKVRQSLDNALSEPLRSNKADRLSIHIDTHENDAVIETSSIELTIQDVENFAAPEQVLEEIAEDHDSTVNIRFLSAFAQNSDRWTIDMYGKELKVVILDNSFLSNVSNGTTEISFGKPYAVELRETITTKGGTGRKSKSYSILRVLGQVGGS